MDFSRGRRRFVFGLGGALVGGALVAGAARAEDGAQGRVSAAQARLAAIEAREACRLGVAVIDTGGGPSLLYRADQHFPMCSTFKLLACATLLTLVDAGKETLDRRIAYGSADLLDYAPVTKKHVDEGGMTLGDLCAAAIDYSDNTAANLILGVIGGPPGVTRYARGLGDPVTRLDRTEPALNTAIPGDLEDTTTPLAMAGDVRKILFGDVLSKGSREQLTAWLLNDRVGDARLRAGLPPSWKIGDKTGSGDYGTANVAAALWPPGRAPLAAAVFLTESGKTMEARNAVHKEIGALIAETFPPGA